MKKIYKKMPAAMIYTAIFFFIFTNFAEGGWDKIHEVPHFGAITFVNENIGYATGEKRVIKTTDGGLSWLTISNINNYFGLGIGFINENTGLLVGARTIGGMGFISITVDGGFQWSEIVITTKQIQRLFILDANNAFVIDLGGSVYRTYNGLNDWHFLTTIQNFEAWSIHFVNSNTGWVVGKDGKIFKTTNGGINWTEQSVGGINFLADVHFINETIGYTIAYNPGRLFKTTDGGNTWLESNIGVGALYNLQFINEDIGYISATNRILKTTDGGISWQQKVLIHLGHYNYNGMYFLNENIGYLIGFRGTTYKTTDGFETFSSDKVGEAQNFKSADFLIQQIAFVVGDNGTILRTTDSGLSWISLPGGTYNNLNHIHILNSTCSFIAGDNGTILRSLTLTAWAPVSVPTTANLNSVYMLDNTLGFAVGDNGTILRTTDGGLGWQSQYPGTAAKLRSVHFFNETIGFAVGDNGTLLKTTNLGEDWEFIRAGHRLTVYQVQFVSANIGYAISEKGLVMKTTNGGENWDYYWSWIQEEDNISMHFSNQNRGVFLATNNAHFRTTTGCQTFSWFWVLAPSFYSQQNSLRMANLFFGYMVGNEGAILRTLDGGTPIPVELVSFIAMQDDSKILLSWQTASEVNNYGFEIQRRFEDSNDWLTIGFRSGGGTTTEIQNYEFIDEILEYDKLSVSYRLKQIDYDGKFEYSEIVTVDNLVFGSYALHQNYPNPFNPSTVISWQSPVHNHQTLKVYDMLGREVATLVDEERPAGKYEVTFDASSATGGLASGVYYYRFTAGEYNSVKKLLFIK